MARKRRWTTRILLAASVLALAAVVDALWIEPNWIEVTRHHVAAPVSPPLKIAHLTDLHTAALDRREMKLLKLLGDEAPDIIVITGDTIANNGEYENIRPLLSRLRAPLGVWLVRGNWENWLRMPSAEERRFYASMGVTFLLNEGREIRPGVWLAGLDDPASGFPRLDDALRDAPPGAYPIILFHAPSFFEKTPGQYPLAFAGHTHGGQVRIPFLDALWLPAASENYIAGWYESGGSKMYVSRGIGMSVLPVRFFCRPELAIHTIGE